MSKEIKFNNEEIKSKLEKIYEARVDEGPSSIHTHTYTVSGRGFVVTAVVNNDGHCTIYNPISRTIIKTIQL